MRLTTALATTFTKDTFASWLPPKLFWGYGKVKGEYRVWWGPHRVKYTWLKDYRKIMTRRQIRVWDMGHEQYVPRGRKIHSAVDVAAVRLNDPIDEFDHPWPFLKKYVSGSKDDPAYQERPGLLYQRHSTLYEGIKGACVFTNTIVESEDALPFFHQELESKLTVDDDSMTLLNDRLQWSTSGDSAMQLMPKAKEFPKLNIIPPRKIGIHPLRRDVSILRSFLLSSDLMINRRFGFLDRRIVDWPSLTVGFERDGHRIVIDLTTDFATLSNFAGGRSLNFLPDTGNSRSNEISNNVVAPAISRNELPIFSSTSATTVDEELFNISPVDWRINFEETNIYPREENYCDGIRLPYKVHTMFLSNNNVNPKLQPDRFVKGRALLYAYAAAVSHARQLNQLPKDLTDPKNYIELPDPITVQVVFYNMTKNNMGFVAFQLNTLSFESQLKNQVWFDGPYDLETQRDILLKKASVFNLAGASQSVLDRVN